MRCCDLHACIMHAFSIAPLQRSQRPVCAHALAVDDFNFCFGRCDARPVRTNGRLALPGTPASRPVWSRAAYRDVRRHAAHASEMKMHSFRVHLDGTVTWTLQHDSVQDRPKPESKGPKTATNLEPSKRTQRSRARAAVHAALMQKAQAFRARSVLRSGAGRRTPRSSRPTAHTVRVRTCPCRTYRAVCIGKFRYLLSQSHRQISRCDMTCSCRHARQISRYDMTKGYNDRVTVE
jgi:hypothetical protein